MLSLDLFGFRANWSPFFLTSLIVVLIAYYFLVLKWYPRFKDGEKASTKQLLFFTAAIILLYIIKGSPIDLLAHIAFTGHMIQMALLYMFIPPLVILGLPNWLWRYILNKPIIKPFFNFFTKPLIALVTFNGVFSLYHHPFIFDLTKMNIWYHAGYTTLIFIFALIMWWPMFTALPEHQTLSGLKKVGYVFADGALITPVCALIIFSGTPLYTTYSDPNAWGQALALCVPGSMLTSLPVSLSGPEMFTGMSLLADQRTGGVIMKILQEIVYGVILAYAFFGWYNNERDKEKAELALYRQQQQQQHPQPTTD